MGQREQQAAIRAYSLTERQVRARVLAFVTATWAGLGSWRDDDVDTFVAAVVPVVAGGQRTVAALTDAYLAAILADQLGGPLRPAGAAIGEQLRGVPPETVYARPFIEMRLALSRGGTLAAAVAAGRRRAQSLAATDLQLARTHAARAVLESRDDITGYRRVLSGPHSCGLCVVASTQRYRKSDLMPIHPGCDCGIAPIAGDADPGQIINEPLLDSAHQAVAERFGAFDAAAKHPVDYRHVLITHEHGELGPVLARKGQTFTGPTDLDAAGG